MPGLLKYGAAFAGLEPIETNPLPLSLYRFLAFLEARPGFDITKSSACTATVRFE